MRTLTDTIQVDAPPQGVWDWLQHLADNYLAWHPDHVSADWIVGEPNQVGSVLEVVEDLGGHRERLRLEVSRVCPPRLMEYRVQGLHALLLPDGAFEVSPSNGGSQFTARIRCRGGGFAQWLFRGRVKALREHMHEEGESLQRRLAGRS